MFFTNGAKYESKKEKLNLARYLAFAVAIVSVAAPIYTLNVDLPSFDSLSKFSGAIQEFEQLSSRGVKYKLKVANNDIKFTFRLPDVNVYNRLSKQLNAGGYVTVWYKRDLMLNRNIYQINKNGQNIVDYKTLVNERQAKGEASLNLSYLCFPVCMMIAFFAHLGLIIENNKEKKSKM